MPEISKDSGDPSAVADFSGNVQALGKELSSRCIVVFGKRCGSKVNQGSCDAARLTLFAAQNKPMLEMYARLSSCA